MHAFDRQTDGQTDGWTEISSQDCICIPCSAVKIKMRTGSADDWSTYSPNLS